MLIGICGSICSGRSTVARYLVDDHGFTHVTVNPTQTGTGQPSSSAPPQTNGNGDKDKDNDEHPQPPSNTHNKSNPAPLVFASPDALLEHVTQRWRDRWVTTDVLSNAVLEAYSRRPFFLLISVDAPLLVRWERYRKLYLGDNEAQSKPQPQAQPQQSDADPPSRALQVLRLASITTNEPPNQIQPARTLEAFAALSDTQLYHPLTGQATTHQLPTSSSTSSTLRLLNTSTSLASLHLHLGKLDLLNPDRLRPSWDTYFMSLASLAAHRSNCMKRRVGCVVVSRTTRRVISTGYNGTPRGLKNCNEGGCPRCNSGLGSGHGLATCLCMHAEENALLEAGRDRLMGGGEDGGGAVLYCDTCPCLTCSIKIAQVGVKEVVYAMGYSMDRETAEVFREAGVKLRQFVPPANGLIHLENMEGST